MNDQVRRLLKAYIYACDNYYMKEVMALRRQIKEYLKYEEPVEHERQSA